MPLNVSGAICRDTSEKIFVERQTGSYVDGIWVAGKSSKFKALASCQHPNSKQLLVLTEGERDENPKVFICNKKLRTLNDKKNELADIVIHKNTRYKIVANGDWMSYGYVQSIGVEIE